MSDKTFGVKVSEELHEKVKSMIESSGIPAKEWFEKAVALTEMNEVKQGATDYKQDLSELEIHTTRIYELITNMVQRSIYLKDAAVKEVSEKLEQKEAIIGQYLEKTKVATEESTQAKEALKLIEQQNVELTKQLDESRSTNENNQALISEYKEKIDTLSGLVTKYQDHQQENERLKEEIAQERKQLQSQINEVMNQNDDQQDEIEELKRQIESLNNSHAIELERTIEKKDYEKDKALLEVEREYQQKLLQANTEYNEKITEYNEKIKSLYDEMTSIRKEYESKLEQLQLQKTDKQQEE